MQAVVYRRARTLDVEERPEEVPGHEELGIAKARTAPESGGSLMKALIDWQEQPR